jgi:dopamine beta-monooxygenase
MIGYRPILTPGSERYVHHMVLYECHDTDGNSDSYSRFNHHVNSGYECHAPNIPPDFKRCRGVIAAWGLGGEPFHFPEEAGFPVGEKHGGATYYMFEVHYDNPGLHGNVVDSSGLEVLLTPNLRKYDSGLLTVGHDVTTAQLIPPGEERFTTVGHCPEVCTRVRNLHFNRLCENSCICNMIFFRNRFFQTMA